MKEEKETISTSGSSFILPPSSFGEGLLDPGTLLSVCGGDEDLLRKMCQTFLARLPDQLAAVRGALGDQETPRFTLQQGPPWLKIDSSTGLLSGVPDRTGTVAIVVTATIEREVRNLDPRQLSWGLEKTLSSGKERVGVATQKFTIDVAP